MSEESRESKVDINDLINKYLSDDAETDGKKAQKPRRHVSARRAPDGQTGGSLAQDRDAAAGEMTREESASADFVPTEQTEQTEQSVQSEQNADVRPAEDKTDEAPEDGKPSADGDVREEKGPDADAAGRENETAASPEDGGNGDADAEAETASDAEPGTAPDSAVFEGYEAEKDAESYDYIEGGSENGDAADSNAEDMDDFDMNILLGLGMEEELENTVGIEKVTKFVEKQQSDLHKTENVNRERAELNYEYTTKSQTREVISMYSSASRLAWLKLAVGVVLTIVLLVIECHSVFGLQLGGALDPLVYPVVYIMAGLQLALLVAALGWRSVFGGFRDFFRGKPTPEAVAGIAILLDIIYSASISFSPKFGETGPMTFNLPVAAMFVMLYIHDLWNVRREIYSFGIISSKKSKYALSCKPMSEANLEHEAFSDLMDENDKADEIGVLSVEGADFVGDFFLRTNRYPGGRKFIGFVIPAVIVVAAAFFAYKFNSTGMLSEGASAAASVAFTCLPLSVFYMFSHPFFRAVSKAREDDCTIIGESSVEEYADAAVISFDDKNVFPSTGVTVRGINVFGNHRIDRVLYMAASTFCAVGGPLSDVFDLATREIGHSENVELGRCMPGLLEVSVDGANVMFGSIDALEGAGVRIPRPIAEHRGDFVDNTVSIMYMVENGRFIARMLIQYLADSDFEFTLRQLDKNGMFVGIRTFDPNVTAEFLDRQIKLKNYPVRIIRCKTLEDKTQTADTTVSGIVSRNSPKPLLQTVTLCEKVLHARSINTMLVIISLFVSLVISALSVIFGAAITLSPLFITLYQIFWILPMYISSRMIVS